MQIHRMVGSIIRLRILLSTREMYLTMRIRQFT